MKLIAINNLEPKYKNLALEKIRIYHEAIGDEVQDYLAIMEPAYDKVYCSSIFDFTPKPSMLSEEKWVIGGTGYDLKTKLPPEIDEIKPRLNFGFTTRGCIRKCPFCVVPEKEGYVHSVGDIYDVWDGESKDLVLFDNNVLALPEHFKKICEQLRAEKLRVDFNQGLDIRLVTEELAKELKSVSHVEYKFAFDFMNMENTIRSKVEILKHHGINRSSFYVLVGYNTKLEDDLYRLNLLRDLGQNAYVMRYKRSREYIPIARWANQRHIFRGMTFEQFINRRENKRCKKYFEGLSE